MEGVQSYGMLAEKEHKKRDENGFKPLKFKYSNGV